MRGDFSVVRLKAVKECESLGLFEISFIHLNIDSRLTIFTDEWLG